MNRYSKALLEYPDGIVTPISEGIIKETKIHDCCPYYIDCGDDDLDEMSVVENNTGVIGCRGITCIECWNKEFIGGL